jgi:hypothetical protein
MSLHHELPDATSVIAAAFPELLYTSLSQYCYVNMSLIIRNVNANSKQFRTIAIAKESVLNIPWFDFLNNQLSK